MGEISRADGRGQQAMVSKEEEEDEEATLVSPVSDTGCRHLPRTSTLITVAITVSSTRRCRASCGTAIRGSGLSARYTLAHLLALLFLGRCREGWWCAVPPAVCCQIQEQASYGLVS